MVRRMRENMADEMIRVGNEQYERGLKVDVAAAIGVRDSCIALSPERLRDLALELGLCAEDYTLINFSYRYHDWGSGGESCSGEILEKDGKTLLVRRVQTSWYTTSDDFFDHSTGNCRDLRIFEEEPLARRYFDITEGGDNGRANN